jgi:predicted Zn-dependent protease
MTASSEQASGSLSAALAHAARLLGRNPIITELQAREVLKVVPEQPEAMRLLGAALRAQGRNEEAVSTLEKLAQRQPRSAAAQFEFALALADMGQTDQAINTLRRAVHFDPRHPHAWRALGDQLTLAGNSDKAGEAYARHIKASVNDPQLLEAAAMLCDGKLAVSERLLRQFLKAHPTDVAAIRMLAEIGLRLGHSDEAEMLLERCLELAPDFVEARHNYAIVLHRKGKGAEAIRELERLLKSDPRNPGYRGLKAAVLGRIGEYERAITTYVQLLKEFPAQPRAWMSYGHALKTVGRTEAAIAVYRRSIELMPSLGEAYWSLANLKTFRFTPQDSERMRAQLGRASLPEEDRVHFHFALGKALEDSARYVESFAEYERGNALRRGTVHYDKQEINSVVERSKALFTREFFDKRANYGAPAPDPIFVVGLTRSGSTLLEQILASHSAVEGTMELPEVLSLARRFGRKSSSGNEPAYPLGLQSMTEEESRALGKEYLSRTRIQRKSARPYFIDKMPNNWANIGFIQLILPNAKIIDARRHPMACCFSNFKQLFARGQGYSYSLADCGDYYRRYVDLMAYFDAVLPGRVHRVTYEQLVDDPDREVHRLLGYCGLNFEPQMLRFYENRRPVRTASSEQVRQPISSDSVDQWKNFEPWLGALKDALGPVISAYPAAPPNP